MTSTTTPQPINVNQEQKLYSLESMLLLYALYHPIITCEEAIVDSVLGIFRNLPCSRTRGRYCVVFNNNLPVSQPEQLQEMDLQ